MRTEGTLVQWNEDRGFGFIEAAVSGERLFVHVSAFERGRVRPPLGTRLVFDVERDAQGRKRAIRVAMPGDFRRPAATASALRPGHRGAQARRTRWPGWTIVALGCVLIALGVFHARRTHLPAQEAAAQRVVPETSRPAPPAGYRCDGRTRCSQMHSCAEATWVSNHCPGTEMDGNHDGVPCEQQWCGSR